MKKDRPVDALPYLEQPAGKDAPGVVTKRERLDELVDILRIIKREVDVIRRTEFFELLGEVFCPILPLPAFFAVNKDVRKSQERTQSIHEFLGHVSTKKILKLEQKRGILKVGRLKYDLALIQLIGSCEEIVGGRCAQQLGDMSRVLLFCPTSNRSGRRIALRIVCASRPANVIHELVLAFHCVVGLDGKR